jgi:hypothetical protein
MKNKLPLLLVLFAAVIITSVSCEKKSIPASLTDPSFGEEFDTVSTAVSRGWVIANNTKPIGTIGWTQGFFYVSLYHASDSKTGPMNYPSSGGFGANNPSYSGSDFIMSTSECGHGVANISNWLISPAVTMKNGDSITFYTRTYSDPAIAADRLEVRVNTLNSSADVGRDSNSIGGFTKVILDINPAYDLDGGYPGEWTRYSATISGLPVAKKSRVAFRYYVPDGGPQGNNSVGIGIDKFEFISRY